VVQLEQLLQRHLALLRNTGKRVTLPYGVWPDLCITKKRCLYHWVLHELATM
jgi:hypothetical protein